MFHILTTVNLPLPQPVYSFIPFRMATFNIRTIASDGGYGYVEQHSYTLLWERKLMQ